eukprot:gene40025-49490_t
MQCLVSGLVLAPNASWIPVNPASHFPIQNIPFGSIFSPCLQLDFEVELGIFVGGQGNPMGQPLKIDIQAWEYVPLGPFLSKNFATSISPWIVTLDALEPFRTSTSAGPVQDNPVPLKYLRDPDYFRSTYDVKLETSISASTPSPDTTSTESDTVTNTDTETGANSDFTLISDSNLKYMYWNMKQQLVHH